MTKILRVEKKILYGHIYLFVTLLNPDDDFNLIARQKSEFYKAVVLWCNQHNIGLVQNGLHQIGVDNPLILSQVCCILAYNGNGKFEKVYTQS